MKKLTTIATLIIISVISSFAQTSAEKEILKLIADYDTAYLNQDIAFAERVWADEYIISGEDGSSRNRAKSLEEARADKANPNPQYKLLSFKSVNDSMRINGNMAVVSGSWTLSIVPTSDLKTEPHIDNGRYTMVLEKRDGKLMVIAEHISEAPHDKKLMEAEVLKMGLEAVNIYKNRDYAAMERIMADDAVFINTTGKVKTKSEVLAELKNRQAKIESVEITDQKVRVIGNGSAIETGLVRYKGTGSNGKSFDETERYTTTWVARNGQWKIVADHTSEIKK